MVLSVLAIITCFFIFYNIWYRQKRTIVYMTRAGIAHSVMGKTDFWSFGEIDSLRYHENR